MRKTLTLDLRTVWAAPHAGLGHALRGMTAVGLLGLAVTDESRGLVEAASVGAGTENALRGDVSGEPRGEGGQQALRSNGDVLAGARRCAVRQRRAMGEPAGKLPAGGNDGAGDDMTPGDHRPLGRPIQGPGWGIPDASTHLGSSSKTEDAGDGPGDAATERGETVMPNGHTETTVKSPVPTRTPDQHTDAAEGIGGAGPAAGAPGQSSSGKEIES